MTKVMHDNHIKNIAYDWLLERISTTSAVIIPSLLAHRFNPELIANPVSNLVLVAFVLFLFFHRRQWIRSFYSFLVCCVKTIKSRHIVIAPSRPRSFSNFIEVPVAGFYGIMCGFALGATFEAFMYYGLFTAFLYLTIKNMLHTYLTYAPQKPTQKKDDRA